MSSFDFERAWRGALNGDGFFREVPGALDIMHAKIVTTGAPVTSSTTPVYTDGDPNYLAWVADAAATVTVKWSFHLPEDYAETTGGASGADNDEIRIMLMCHSTGDTGTVGAAVMTPTLAYRRAGAAAASVVALTGWRRGLTREICMGIPTANPFTTGTTFTCTDQPTNPEWVELQFKGNGFKALDAMQFTLGPTAVTTNDIFRLYTASLRPKRFAAAVLDPQLRY